MNQTTEQYLKDPMTLRGLSEICEIFEEPLSGIGAFPLFFYMADGSLACITPEGTEGHILEAYGENHGLNPNDLLDEPVYVVESPETSFAQAKRETEQARQHASEMVNTLGIDGVLGYVEQVFGPGFQEATHIHPLQQMVQDVMAEIEGLHAENFQDRIREIVETEQGIARSNLEQDTTPELDEAFEDAYDALDFTEEIPHRTPTPGTQFIWALDDRLRVIVDVDMNLTRPADDHIVAYVPGLDRVGVFTTRPEWNNMVARGEILFVK